jgi:site-specific recombinase XerD
MEEYLLDDSKAGARDQAMIAFAWQLGPRVHEIIGLTMKDITLAESTAPGYFVRLIAKGNKQLVYNKGPVSHHPKY